MALFATLLAGSYSKRMHRRCKAITQRGNAVRAYDAERTLCNIVRGRKVVDPLQVTAPAMRAHTASRDRNVSKLMGYARKLEVERKIRAPWRRCYEDRERDAAQDAHQQ